MGFLEDKLKELHKSALNNIPYSSAVSMYVIAGKSVTSRFGGNCIEQNNSLKKNIENTGMSDTLLIRDLLIGRNHSLVVKLNGIDYYSSVYLMPHEPVNLQEVLDTEGHKKIVDAYPHVNGEKSQLTIIFDDSGKRFRVHKTWPNSKRVDEFEYDLKSKDNKFPTSEEYRGIAFHEEQDTLSLRILNTEAARVDHLVFPLENNTPFIEYIYVKTNEGLKIPITLESKFDEVIQPISNQIGISKDKLIEFIYNSAKLHFQMR